MTSRAPPPSTTRQLTSSSSAVSIGGRGIPQLGAWPAAHWSLGVGGVSLCRQASAQPPDYALPSCRGMQPQQSRPNDPTYPFPLFSPCLQPAWLTDTCRVCPERWPLATIPSMHCSISPNWGEEMGHHQNTQCVRVRSASPHYSGRGSPSPRSSLCIILSCTLQSLSPVGGLRAGCEAGAV